MPIPYETIRLNVKEKRITRINQLFEYASISEWKEETGFRKGVIERLMEDPARFAIRHIWKISDAAALKETTVERLIEGQKRYNRLMKKEGGQPGERQGRSLDGLPL